MTLGERIYEILTSDDYIVVRDHLLHEVESIKKEEVGVDNVAYKATEYGFTVGLAFALTQPEPLEPLWSVSDRAHELVEEVRDLHEKGRQDFRLCCAAERGERLAEQAEKAAS